MAKCSKRTYIKKDEQNKAYEGMAALYQKGHSIAEIQETYHLSSNRIRGILRARPDIYPKINKIQSIPLNLRNSLALKAKALYLSQNYTIAQIASKLGFKSYQIRQLLDEAGLNKSFIQNLNRERSQALQADIISMNLQGYNVKEISVKFDKSPERIRQIINLYKNK